MSLHARFCSGIQYIYPVHNSVYIPKQEFLKVLLPNKKVIISQEQTKDGKREQESLEMFILVLDIDLEEISRQYRDVFLRRVYKMT